MSDKNTPNTIRCKRAYDEASENDGYRVLVDRIWPRGIRKETLALDSWEKDLAPSNKLRKWFNHDPQLWAGFYQKYFDELKKRQRTIDKLLDDCGGRRLTLVYSAKDTEYNNAMALKKFLETYLTDNQRES
ncbi:DUF488 domain-containing protein [Vreelandella salicampi]|uniref:DUF488 domain-containing protein n=1 Tax=Vreelandella salicampi TaxID=1449798 RepID=A0A7Z0LPD7_9GAMM|nr:DUF488 domain-containing protein [Halomonas salicampi]NYS62615.1 DUF488 domain-containing protein [Halomonas salicampi]